MPLVLLHEGRERIGWIPTSGFRQILEAVSILRQQSLIGALIRSFTDRVKG
jgi:hypothetical protein